MAVKLSVLALLVAIVALGAVLLALPGDRGAAPAPDPRIANLEARVAELTRSLDDLARRPGGLPVPAATGASAGTTGAPAGPDAAAAPREDLEEIVDAAVEKKTREVMGELAAKGDGEKPSMDLFAKKLGLSDEQRRSAEWEVIRAQREVLSLLDTPAADGRNFLDDLVDAYAQGIASPGEDNGWNLWLLRVTSTKVPGTDETYAQRADALKETVRAAFRRDFTDEQYGWFEAWKLDPTEIEDIEGSPYEDIGRRIRDRARELGAELPEEDG